MTFSTKYAIIQQEYRWVAPRINQGAALKRVRYTREERQMNKAATILVLGNGGGLMLYTGPRTAGRAHNVPEVEVLESLEAIGPSQQEVDHLVETAGLMKDLAECEEKLQSAMSYIDDLQSNLRSAQQQFFAQVLELRADIAEVTEQREVFMAQRDTLANEILDLHERLGQVTAERLALGNEFLAQSIELARVMIQRDHLQRLLNKITSMTVMSPN